MNRLMNKNLTWHTGSLNFVLIQNNKKIIIMNVRTEIYSMYIDYIDLINKKTPCTKPAVMGNVIKPSWPIRMKNSAPLWHKERYKRFLCNGLLSSGIWPTVLLQFLMHLSDHSTLLRYGPETFLHLSQLIQMTVLNLGLQLHLLLL